MVESAQPLLRKWEEECININEGEGEGEGGCLSAADVMVNEDLRSASADVIARACFGTSYCKGKHIFSKLRSLQQLICSHSFLFGLSTLGYVM